MKKSLILLAIFSFVVTIIVIFFLKKYIIQNNIKATETVYPNTIIKLEKDNFKIDADLTLEEKLNKWRHFIDDNYNRILEHPKKDIREVWWEQFFTIEAAIRETKNIKKQLPESKKDIFLILQYYIENYWSSWYNEFLKQNNLSFKWYFDTDKKDINNQWNELDFILWNWKYLYFIWDRIIDDNENKDYWFIVRCLDESHNYINTSWLYYKYFKIDWNLTVKEKLNKWRKLRKNKKAVIYREEKTIEILEDPYWCVWEYTKWVPDELIWEQLISEECLNKYYIKKEYPSEDLIEKLIKEDSWLYNKVISWIHGGTPSTYSGINNINWFLNLENIKCSWYYDKEHDKFYWIWTLLMFY
jgi:hypothetical protein